MAKVNLLTIHWGLSYGAIMQTYATSRLLEENGHEVSVINIVPNKERGDYSLLRWVILSAIRFQFWIFKRIHFPNLTKKMRRIDRRMIRISDYNVVGSDQVWNKEITAPIESNFFLDFDDCPKKVSLASSFGKSNWAEDTFYTSKVLSCLKKFTAISVREDTGKRILKEQFGLNSEVLIDPTLAYGRFDDLVLHNTPSSQVYTFFISDKNKYDDIVDHIVKDKNSELMKHSKFSYYFSNGPRNWLTYIKNASCVITDSFHGVAFSLIFQKEFYVLCGDRSKLTRITNLLGRLGLDGRIVDSIEDYDLKKQLFQQPINYQLVNEILMIERERYREFISQHIQ